MKEVIKNIVKGAYEKQVERLWWRRQNRIDQGRNLIYVDYDNVL